MASSESPDKYAALEDAILQLQDAVCGMVDNFEVAAVGYERTIALAAQFHNVLDVEREGGPRRLTEADKEEGSDPAAQGTTAP